MSDKLQYFCCWTVWLEKATINK